MADKIKSGPATPVGSRERHQFDPAFERMPGRSSAPGPADEEHPSRDQASSGLMNIIPDCRFETSFMNCRASVCAAVSGAE